jgi:hypothetical protein
MASNRNWYGSAFRRIHLHSHVLSWMCNVAKARTAEGDQQQARIFHEAGIQPVEFFAHGHHGFCVFPAAEHGLAHPGFAKDYTGEMTAVLREEGIRDLAGRHPHRGRSRATYPYDSRD